jgi:hypothetical protein
MMVQVYMLKSYAVIAALVLVACMIPAGIFAMQNTPTLEQRAEGIALKFLKSSPTFFFDGITDTVKIVDVQVLESYPVQYKVVIEFVSQYPGFGNRTGRVMLGHSQQHIIKIIVVEGKVTGAVIDDVWDEVNQKTIAQPSDIIELNAYNWLLSSPSFKFDGLVNSVKMVEIWQAMTFAAPSFWQVTFEFDSQHPGYGDRADQILAQVITHHSVRIHVTEGKITMAIIDEVWDELNQSMLPSVYTTDNAREVALEWMYGCPTFKFDGVLEKVKIQQVDTLRMPNAYAVYVEFVSQYPGFGERTGRLMLGHSQQHIIKITVVEGKVTGAVIDDVWDEMNQKSIQNTMPPLVEPISTEEAKDVAIKYIIDLYGLSIPIPENWEYSDLTPKDLLGASTIQFTGEKTCLVTMKFAVVMRPTYSVEVMYTGKDGSGFSWSGTVDSTGKVEESSSSLTKTPVDDGNSTVFGIEDARNMAVKYIMEKHPDLKVAIPLEWSEKNLNEGFLGYSKIEYSSEGWIIIVEGPVVWKPDYNVQATFNGSVSFTWKGLVPNGGPIQELGLQK